MNSMRRRLFTACLVALLVVTLIAPMSVSAARPNMYQAHVFVEEGTEAILELGDVALVVPEGAMPRTGPIVVKVTVSEDVVTVDFHPKYEFNSTVYLGFRGETTAACQVNKGGNELVPLVEANPAPADDGYTYYEINSFSRYSGWF